MIVIAACVVGAGLGFWGGAWYGFATDKSDMPIMAAFTAPTGAVIGAVAGTVLATVLT